MGNDTKEFLKNMVNTNFLETTIFANKLIELCDKNKIRLNLLFTSSFYAYIAPDH